MFYILSIDFSYNIFFIVIPLINRYKQYLQQCKFIKVRYETECSEMLNTQVPELLRYIDCAMSWIVNQVKFQAGAEHFSCLHSHQTGSGDTVAVSPDIHLHSPPCNVKVKNVWSYMPFQV